MGKIIILGGGLAGLSAGYHAELNKLDYILYEKNDRVGGLSGTKEKEGFLFDFSGHLLHLKNPYFIELIRGLLGDQVEELQRNSWIYSNNVFTPYPFQANLHGLPWKVVRECLFGFMHAAYKYNDLPSDAYNSFYDWIIAKLGAGIGKHFMFPYNEKIWTIGTEELTCEWLSEYVPRPSLKDVFLGSLFTRKKKFGYNSTFLYPQKGGIQSLADALSEKTLNIHTSQSIVNVNIKERTITTEDARTEEYDHLITTAPLKALVEKIVDHKPETIKMAAAKLRHNSLLILNLGVRGDMTDKHWVYIPEKKIMPYRIGVYSNFSPCMSPPHTTSYYVEIAYQQAWRIQKHQVIDRALEEMTAIGFIPDPRDILVRDVEDVEYGYIIYDSDMLKNRKLILDYLRSNNIYSIGRYGGWEYSGMEEALIAGKKSIEEITANE